MLRRWSALVALGIGTLAHPALADVFSSVVDVALPLAPGAQDPALFALPDGRIAISWTTPTADGFAVKVATGDGTGWQPAHTVVETDGLFVNWADIPSVAAFGDGTLAVHWLNQSDGSGYDYDVNVRLSSDDGQSWGPVIVPHRDTSNSQHGFVSLVPVGPSQMMAIWLDGRAYDPASQVAGEPFDPGAMQLRTTQIGSDGALSADTLLDVRTCSCCQTSATVTDDGAVLVAYRDRTADDIRDIAVLRLQDGTWAPPVTVHDDGWQISGCPVNGPAISAQGGRVVAAWFTAPDDVPVAQVAFSDDGGRSFGTAHRLNLGETAGRVDAVMLSDGSALVTWVEWSKVGEAIMVCRARPETGCVARQQLALNTEDGTVNFPKMIEGRDGVYVAWTQPLNPRTRPDGQDVTVRMVLARF